MTLALSAEGSKMAVDGRLGLVTVTLTDGAAAVAPWLSTAIAPNT